MKKYRMKKHKSFYNKLVKTDPVVVFETLDDSVARVVYRNKSFVDGYKHLKESL